MECSALKWVVCDKLHHYLYGNQFQVVTNSNPLTNILSKAKLDPTGQRSVAAIAIYNFQISYRSGHLNGESLVSSFKRSVTVLSDDLGGGFNSNGRWEEFHTDTLNTNDWMDEQSRDENVHRVVQTPRSSFRSKEGNVKRAYVEVQNYLRIFKKLKIVNGILCKIAIHWDRKFWQLVVPLSFTVIALQGIHNDVGHPGEDKTSWLARKRF